MNFKPISEHELARLKDDELISHAVAARDARKQDAFEETLKLFVGRRFGLVEYWVSRKSNANDRDEIVSRAFVSIIKGIGKFRGRSTGQMVEWMRTVTGRRIADFYRDKEKTPRMVPLGEQPKEDEDWGPTNLGNPDDTGGVEVEMLIEQTLETRNEVQQEVIRLRMKGYSSKEVAEMSSDQKMSFTNVDKIFSRFRQDIEKAMSVDEVSKA
ncbi:MAG TPA: sigma-70 family RNA polymerase sigma factor, partial [Solirubrobacterales bacterium]|nr:sigma-70 family RNA polymerase sigma factor [Solirubrobacterales bacterium]